MTKKEFIIYFVNMDEDDWDDRFEGVEIDSETNLKYADLNNADLSSANLEGANLRGANLEGAYLEGVDLYKANLNDADLRYASIGSVIDKKRGRYDN